VFLALAVDERLVFLAVVGRVVSDVLDAQAHQAELALGFFVQVGAADSGDTAAHLNHSELVVVIADLIADAGLRLLRLRLRLRPFNEPAAEGSRQGSAVLFGDKQKPVWADDYDGCKDDTWLGFNADLFGKRGMSA
jgi:hypothetical protein